MTARTPTLTRRTIVALLLTVPALLGLPAAAGATQRIAPEQRLRTALARLELPFAPARLDLISFAQATGEGAVRLRATVQMTWPPGIRRRPFSARDTTVDRALDRLVTDIAAQFSAAGWRA